MGAEPRAIQWTSAPFSRNSCCEFITLIRVAIYEANKAPFVRGHIGEEMPDQFTLEGRGAREKLSRTGNLCRYYQTRQNERGDWQQGTGLKSPTQGIRSHFSSKAWLIPPRKSNSYSRHPRYLLPFKAF